MKCPSCGGRTRVYDTRARLGGVLRRRQCKVAGCWAKFVTVEQAALVGRRRRGAASRPWAGGRA